jgi:hypothetical protein
MNRVISIAVILAAPYIAIAQSLAVPPPKQIVTAESLRKGWTMPKPVNGVVTFWIEAAKDHPPLRFRLVSVDPPPENSKADRSFEPVIGRIEISTAAHPKPLQVIKVRSAQSTVKKLFLEQLFVEDVDFDGCLDFSYVDEISGRGCSQNFWIFDPATERFIHNDLTRELYALGQNGPLKIDPKRHEIEAVYMPRSYPKEGHQERAVYQIKDGHLRLVREVHWANTKHGFRVLTRERVDETWRITKNRPLNPSDMQ